jgi:hypothetical protein
MTLMKTYLKPIFLAIVVLFLMAYLIIGGQTFPEQAKPQSDLSSMDQAVVKHFSALAEQSANENRNIANETAKSSRN